MARTFNVILEYNENHWTATVREPGEPDVLGTGRSQIKDYAVRAAKRQALAVLGLAGDEVTFHVSEGWSS